MFKKNQKGFTLIELLIVIAIIAILAAIAIPQFAAYRIKGYNASAEADLRNCRTAEEAMFADYRVYGYTPVLGNVGMMLPGPGGFGGGVITSGPLSSATQTFAGSLLTATDSTAAPVGVGIALGASVDLVAQTDAGVTNGSSYTIFAKHVSGNRVFGGELESSGLYFQEQEVWIGQTLTVVALAPIVTTAADLAAPWKSL